MPLPTKETIGILADNLRLRNSVLPLAQKAVTRWANGLGLPRGGETIIYTGMMYQLAPAIAAMNKTQEKIEDSWLANFVGMGRYVNKVVNISAFLARPAQTMRSYCERVLANIAALLQRAGVECGYLYEDELYSGALIYDLGVDDLFERHAWKVAKVFEKYQVKNIITVDPHTTHLLRSVYPAVLPGPAWQVRSYLEVLAERDLKPVSGLDAAVALHDSCLYARPEKIFEEPRTLLSRAGIAVREPANSGKFTLCCGGPAESLFPKKAVARAAARMEQIRQAGEKAVTMCPLCLVNLRKAAPASFSVEDIAVYLGKAYLP
ncbi:MAG: (Fe-S)-binding protein [Armatimonadetes bacterium]|nr:(Fe-S)-binding protein [Armatimonadota bacterium]